MSRKRPRRTLHRKYEFTAARRAALDRARAKRTFEMTPAKWAAVRKAARANQLNFRLTPARRRAMSANGRKMQRASVEKYRKTEARLAASRANIRKAHRAPRKPESYARARFNHLKHGLQVRSLEETMHLLGDDPKEFEAHKRRFARVFAPANPTEERIVQRIAAAAWRQLRLFKAQALWQSDQLKRHFHGAPVVQPLDADATRYRALCLMMLLTDRRRFLRHDQGLTAGVERALRTLLRLRSGGDPDFQLYTHQTERERQEYKQLQQEMAEQQRKIAEEERDLRFWERLYQGGPEVEAAIARLQERT